MNEETINLINKKTLLERSLSELVYGSPEVRTEGNKRYIYVHYRLSGKQITNFVGEYSDELLNLIASNNEKVKPIKRELREVKHRLNTLSYQEPKLPEKVQRNLDFAKRNLTLTIHSQAILEGVATTFASTEEIIEGSQVRGMSPVDIAKIVNMKHAWEFILDPNVITSESGLTLVMQINKLVEEGFYYNAGRLRDVPVRIGGTRWSPDLPIESKVKEDLAIILNAKKSNTDKAIDLVLYLQKSQLFIDGNKRTAIIFANHFLISKGLGLIYIPAEKVEEYKALLVKYYETGTKSGIVDFLKNHCLLKI